MSTKHTPGPWEVVDNTFSDRDEAPRILIGRRQWIHATGQPWVAERIAIMDGASDADERLMEAAPALLAELKNLREQLRAHFKLDVKKHYSLMVAEVAADKVIRRAEGDV